MKTLDIRKEESVKEIIFDDSEARVIINPDGLEIRDEDRDEYICCDWENLDNFILAILKGRELWHKPPC